MILEITRRPFLRNKFLFNIRFFNFTPFVLHYLLFYRNYPHKFIEAINKRKKIKKKKKKKKNQVFGYTFTD